MGNLALASLAKKEGEKTFVSARLQNHQGLSSKISKKTFFPDFEHLREKIEL